MNESSMLMQVRDLLKFPFRGPNWVNRMLVGLGVLIAGGIIPVLPGLVWWGYMLQIMREAANGEGEGLPEWKDWGRLLLDGLRMAVVEFTFLLPGLLVTLVGFKIYLISAIAFPIYIINSQQTQSSFSLAITLLVVGLIIFILSLIVGRVLFFLGTLPLPVAITHMAVEGKLSAGFSFRSWFPILWKNKGVYLAAWVIIIGLVGILVTFLSTVYMFILFLWIFAIIVISILATPFILYLALVFARIFGLFYRESKAALDAKQAE
jgi:hypothetical protein